MTCAVVGASRKADDDHSDVELFRASPVTPTERGERTPPPEDVELEGGGMDMTRMCG